MNKRKRKKRKKIISERIAFLNKHLIVCSGRKNGKTFLYRKMHHAIMSKQYKPFKDIKKYFEKLFISVDYGNGMDYTAITHAYIDKGKVKIMKIEVQKGGV